MPRVGVAVTPAGRIFSSARLCHARRLPTSRRMVHAARYAPSPRWREQPTGL